jgi:hypothetical protein
MAPAEQLFTSPATCGDICRTVRNWAIDEAHDFIFHVALDPLIAWGFAPIDVNTNDNKPTPPAVNEMNHREYIALSSFWARDGYPCSAENPVNPEVGFPNEGEPITTALDDLRRPGEGDRPNPMNPDDGAWWMDRTNPKFGTDKLIPQKGLPPECRRSVMGEKLRLLTEEELVLERRLSSEELMQTCKRLVRGDSGRR